MRGSQFFGTDPVDWRQFSQEFRLVPIPEPGVSILLGLGLMVLAARRRAD